ncbi:MAG: hypothetical protein J6C18_00395 [Bacteroidaceae bacterium]|nr:hypothetical protein [Bacteroidaceae bacterium]
MKRPFYILALLGCIISFAACTGPVIIDEEEEDNTEQGDDTLQRDSVPIIHEGTRTSPYSIAEAQTLRRGRGVWIEGYIVGCVKGSMKSGCNYTSEATTTANILLADTFPTGNEEDYLYCLPVELPNGDIRMELNLYDNPENYHRKVRIAGDLTLYYSVVGLKEIADYTWDTDDENENEDENDNDDENDDEDEDDDDNDDENYDDDDPNRTTSDTLSIAEGIRIQNQGEQYYIRGYIVGFFNGKSFRFNPSEEEINNSAKNNVVLADSIGETDPNRVIIVELTKDTALRRYVNLFDNPQNLNKRLTVKGMLIDYKETSYHGCMKTLSNLLEDEDYYFLLE